MKRRDFVAKAGLAMGALSLTAATAAKKKKKVIRPQRLRKGDTVSLISPASFVTDEGLEKAIVQLESLGLVVKLGKHIREQHGYIAGKDEQRLEDLHTAFSDTATKAAWCVRGGYGSARLLPSIDFKLIKKHPKILIGYSDITALLNGIHKETGLVTFHGPVGASELTDYTKAEVLNQLFHEGSSPDIYMHSKQNPLPHFGWTEGKLMGGNLSLLAAMAGTPWFPDLKGGLLFMEDIGEEPYRLDRMWTTLRQQPNFNKLTGMLIGQFTDCNPKIPETSLSLEATIQDRLLSTNIPQVHDFSIGHVLNQCTLPIGMQAKWSTVKRCLELDDWGVE